MNPENVAQPADDMVLPSLTPEQSQRIQEIKDKAFQAGYAKRDAEARDARVKSAGKIAKMLSDEYLNGLKEGTTKSELRTIYAQPYEITTDVGVKYSAKGECQPEASVKITRFLEDGSQITELIKADLARGVEEMMIAVAEIQKRSVRT